VLAIGLPILMVAGVGFGLYQRRSGEARVYLTRIGAPPADKARWGLALGRDLAP
jgi:hypothetical protein